MWDKSVLKEKVNEIAKKYSLTINACLEKFIRIRINWEECTIMVQNWEEGQLVPRYRST